MDNDRLIHSISVARKMVEIGKRLNLKENELKELFTLGYNHDIGYEFGNNDTHNEIGSEILNNCNYKYYNEIKYHGIPNSPYQSLYLDILNQADMFINKYGEDVGYDKRLEDIKARYGENSIKYNDAIKLINEIKKRNI